MKNTLGMVTPALVSCMTHFYNKGSALTLKPVPLVSWRILQTILLTISGYFLTSSWVTDSLCLHLVDIRDQYSRIVNKKTVKHAYTNLLCLF